MSICNYRRKPRTMQRTEPATQEEINTLLSEYLSNGGQIKQGPDDNARITFPRAFPMYYRDGAGKRSGGM